MERFTRLNLTPEDVSSLSHLVINECLGDPRRDYSFREITVLVPDGGGMVDTGQIFRYGGGYDKRQIELVDKGPGYLTSAGLIGFQYQSTRNNGHGAILDLDPVDQKAHLIPQSERELYGPGECTEERFFQRPYLDAVSYINDSTARDITDIGLQGGSPSPFEVLARLLKRDGAKMVIDETTTTQYTGERLSNLEPLSHHTAELRITEFNKGTKPLTTELKLGLFSLYASSKYGDSLDLSMFLEASYDHLEREVNDLKVLVSVKDANLINRYPQLSVVVELAEAMAKLGR